MVEAVFFVGARSRYTLAGVDCPAAVLLTVEVVRCWVEEPLPGVLGINEPCSEGNFDAFLVTWPEENFGEGVLSRGPAVVGQLGWMLCPPVGMEGLWGSVAIVSLLCDGLPVESACVSKGDGLQVQAAFVDLF